MFCAVFKFNTKNRRSNGFVVLSCGYIFRKEIVVACPLKHGEQYILWEIYNYEHI